MEPACTQFLFLLLSCPVSTLLFVQAPELKGLEGEYYPPPLPPTGKFRITPLDIAQFCGVHSGAVVCRMGVWNMEPGSESQLHHLLNVDMEPTTTACFLC